MMNAVGRVETVLLLGGSSEIGLATLKELAHRGCSRAILAGRPGPRLDEAAELAGSYGISTVSTETFDATDVAGHGAFAERVFDAAGNVDVVIVAAGVLGDQERDAHDPASAHLVMDANYAGLAAAMLAVADRMRAQGHGALVVLSSVAGVRVRAANFVYGSTKAALDGFAQGLRDSLAGSGVSVVIVRPGFVVGRMTEGMTPAPFATTPDAVAADIVNAVTRRRSDVYSPAILRWVFLVMRALPRAIWRRLPG